MARLGLEEVRDAIRANRASWKADETEISPYLALDAPDIELLGLSLGGFEQSLLEKTASETLTYKSPPPPQSIDWRDFKGQNWVTKVRHQKTCGACVAFATCAVLESRAKWIHRNPNLSIDLSVAHLFFCGAGEACETGWEIEQALEFCRDCGVGWEVDFPYTPQNQACIPIRPVVKVSSWEKRIAPYYRKKAIAEDGPVIAGMKVFEDMYYYRGGIYQHVAGEFRGYHAVAVIGYNDNAPKKYWIVKNSWGTGWGKQGFMCIADEELNTDLPFYDPSVAYPVA